MANKKKSPLDIIICLVQKDKAEFAVEIMNDLDIFFQVATICKGREKSGFLDMLGVTETELTLIAGFIESSKTHNAMYNLCRNLELYRAYNGMAFSIPVVAISRKDLNRILKFSVEEKENKENKEEKKEDKIEKEEKASKENKDDKENKENDS